MFGCMGKILRVNLSRKAICTEPLTDEVARKYLGGRGLAAYVLMRELPARVDPLGADNKLVFATGLLTGTLTPVGNRIVVAAKSPLTGIWGDSVIGGFFGSKLKSAGVDAIIFEGQAESPVYLWVHDGQAEIRPASDLWGLETGPAQEAILGATHPQASVALIGPAGENGVRYAAILADLRYAAGRDGMGTVMGAKRLKALAVYGKQQPQAANPEELRQLSRAVLQEFRTSEASAVLSVFGTWGALRGLANNGILPVHNFRGGEPEGITRLDSQAVKDAILKKRETCARCSIVCRPVVELDGPMPVSSKYGGPEYETVAALGSLVDNFDPVVIAKANELCNRLGIDAISAGACIAFAMECCERGIDLGSPVPWGDATTILSLLEDIAVRRGVGDVLALGTREAARRIGQGSEAWATEIKGREMAMHDPRGKKGQGISMTTSPKGGDHMQAVHDEGFQVGGPYPELGLDKAMNRLDTAGKAQMVKITQDAVATIADCLGLCKLPMLAWRPMRPYRVVEFVRLVTGWDFVLPELQLAGERVFNLCRLFNVREGVSRRDDRLPPRLGEPLPSGKSAGESFDQATLEPLLDEYYTLRGWDERGIPKPDTLERLGLTWAKGLMSEP